MLVCWISGHSPKDFEKVLLDLAGIAYPPVKWANYHLAVNQGLQKSTSRSDEVQAALSRIDEPVQKCARLNEPRKVEDADSIKIIAAIIIAAISGKPLQVLKDLAIAPEKRRTAAELQDSIWGDDSEAFVDTVKNAVSDLREILRVVARKNKIRTKDPIPCIDCGRNLAWKLTFPA